MTKLFAYAALAAFLGGCASERYMVDSRHPEIAVMESGLVTYRGNVVDPEDLPGLLSDSGLTKSDTIRIHVPDGMRDMRVPGKVIGILVRNGFPRSILLSDRKSYSSADAGPAQSHGRLIWRDEGEY